MSSGGEMFILQLFKSDSGSSVGLKLFILTLILCLPAAKTSSEAPLAEVIIPDDHSDFMRGDCSADGILDMNDVIMVLQVVFVRKKELPCEAACDLDGNGRTDLIDVVHSLQYLMNGVVKPIYEHPKICGRARHPFELGCRDGCFR